MKKQLKMNTEKNGNYSADKVMNLKPNDKIVFYESGYDSKEHLVTDIVKSEYKVFLKQKSILLEEAVISSNV